MHTVGRRTDFDVDRGPFLRKRRPAHYLTHPHKQSQIPTTNRKKRASRPLASASFGLHARQDAPVAAGVRQPASQPLVVVHGREVGAMRWHGALRLPVTGGAGEEGLRSVDKLWVFEGGQVVSTSEHEDEDEDGELLLLRAAILPNGGRHGHACMRSDTRAVGDTCKRASCTGLQCPSTTSPS